MTSKEANKIFKGWQEYAEINDKLQQLFGFTCAVPESFLPYSKETLEEALNIVAKEYFDAGDHKASHAIQEGGIATLWNYKDDEVAVKEIVDRWSWILKSPDLKNAWIANLKKSRDSWAKLKTGEHYYD